MKTILSPFISILLFTHIYSETLKDTQPNKIPLLKDENGYYLNIVLTNSTTDFSKEVPMMVDLCTSYTIFGSNCLNFTSYDCGEFSCEPLTGLIRSGAFDMTFDSNLIAANISLGADNWTPNWTLLANVCSSTDEGYGKSRYGVLGLGLQSPIERQEISMPPIYSVYINQNNTHGDIVFGFDQKYAKTTSPLATVYFENSFVTYVYLGKRIIAEIVDITFDMNADALYMDSNTLQTFIFSLADYNITCSSETTDRPVCNGTIKDYPSLYVTDFRYSFAITPEIYILRNSQDDTAGTVVLNIKILGESKRKQSSVGDLIGEIIFGSDFMSSYYLVFNSTETDTSISLYPAQHGIQDIETTEVHEQRYVASERTLLDVESPNQPSLLSKHIRYRL